MSMNFPCLYLPNHSGPDQTTHYQALPTPNMISSPNLEPSQDMPYFTRPYLTERALPNLPDSTLNMIIYYLLVSVVALSLIF